MGVTDILHPEDLEDDLDSLGIEEDAPGAKEVRGAATLVAAIEVSKLEVGFSEDIALEYVGAATISTSSSWIELLAMSFGWGIYTLTMVEGALIDGPEHGWLATTFFGLSFIGAFLLVLASQNLSAITLFLQDEQDGLSKVQN